MKYLHHQSLVALNTFHFQEYAEQLVYIRHINDLKQVLQEAQQPWHILGGGSNIVLTQSLKGTVLVNQLQGIDILSENEAELLVRFGSGERWHDAVLWTIERNLGGIENLSLIPGTVGAAPMQNIGAYGVELKDVFVSLEAIHLSSLETIEFSSSQCEFGYRESVFKHACKNQFFITSVTLRLQKNPVLRTDYGSIADELNLMGIEQPTVRDVSNAVIRIRQSKLPDPADIGNSGSFFKNPVVSVLQAQQLQATYSTMPTYPAPNGIKIPAGWLIEQTGWKGFREGDYGVHQKQALVLVNYGKASGQEVLNLAQRIIHSVQNTFGITLQCEVNIW